MAGLKETFSKGIATINVKTNNFMEQNKINTYISTLEKEIYNLKFQIGEKIFMDWKNGDVNIANIEPQLKMISDKYQEIQEQNKKIEEMQMKERQILGNAYNNVYNGGVNPGMNNPVKNNPGMNNPGINNPGMNNPGVNNPAMNNPGINNPGMNNPGVNNPAMTNPGINNPGMNNPGMSNPGVNNPTMNNPGKTNPDVNGTDMNNKTVDSDKNHTQNDNNVEKVSEVSCSRCGAMNNSVYKFCVKCGNPLK